VAILSAHAVQDVGNSAPALPREYDEATIERLVSKIDEGQNAAILQFGYFLGRSRNSCPIDKVLSLLLARAEVEPAGSQNWYLVQSLAAFGTLNGRSRNPITALHLYEIIFDQALKTDAPQTAPVVQRAIGDFTFSLRPDSQKGHITYDNRLDGTIEKALRAHFHLLQAFRKPDLEPAWGQAVQRAANPIGFASIVEDAIGRSRPENRYSVLISAAAIYERLDRKRCIEILLQAKQLSPSPEGSQAKWVLQRLVHNEIATDDTASALVHQREYVRITRRGWPSLVRLQWLQQDWVGVEKSLLELRKSTVAEDELMACAEMVFSSKENTTTTTKLHDVIRDVLIGYLREQRLRRPEWELQARVLLARYYRDIGDRKSARDVLDMSSFSSLQTGRFSSLFSMAMRVRESLTR